MRSTTKRELLEEQIRLVQEWKVSGMTQVDFAAAKGIGLRALEYRIRKIRNLAPEKLADTELETVEFVPVPIECIQTPEGVHIDSGKNGQPVLMIQSGRTCLRATNQIEPYLLKTALEVMLTC